MQEERNNNGGSTENSGNQRNTDYATRQPKIEFPRFNGDYLTGWMYRCQQFFKVDSTPAWLKVKLAAVNLEGRALQWHVNWIRYMGGNELVIWEEYVAALEIRFGTQGHKDPIYELLKIKQTGTVSAYHDLFEFLLDRVTVSEDYAVSFFINGLKPIIQQQVKMFFPKTVSQAYDLAQLFEDLAARTYSYEANYVWFSRVYF